MQSFLFLVIGALLMLIFTKQPLKIEIIHTENKEKPLDIKPLEEALEKELQKPEQNQDKLDELMFEVNEIMGGSDR